MTTKKITLNAEKRKVIADQFQSFYEDKVKDKLIQAKQQYDLMRVKAKEQIEKVVRFHERVCRCTSMWTQTLTVGYLLSAIPWLSTNSQGCPNGLEGAYNLNNLLSANPGSFPGRTQPPWKLFAPKRKVRLPSPPHLLHQSHPLINITIHECIHIDLPRSTFSAPSVSHRLPIF